uniref:Uncharacterized protein n=1 Tax=Tetranychus urticae TaxID=32264 RepID=T1JXI6_TETUR
MVEIERSKHQLELAIIQIRCDSISLISSGSIPNTIILVFPFSFCPPGFDLCQKKKLLCSSFVHHQPSSPPTPPILQPTTTNRLIVGKPINGIARHLNDLTSDSDLDLRNEWQKRAEEQLKKDDAHDDGGDEDEEKKESRKNYSVMLLMMSHGHCLTLLMVMKGEENKLPLPLHLHLDLSSDDDGDADNDDDDKSGTGGSKAGLILSSVNHKNQSLFFTLPALMDQCFHSNWDKMKKQEFLPQRVADTSKFELNNQWMDCLLYFDAPVV